jgi:hypothetical protein
MNVLVTQFIIAKNRRTRENREGRKGNGEYGIYEESIKALYDSIKQLHF